MNLSEKVSKSLVKSNPTTAVNRSTLASIKPGHTTNDVVVVTRQVEETKKEIENLKAELQKLITSGVKNNLTNNAINLRNNKNESPVQREIRETIKTSNNDLNNKDVLTAGKVNKENNGLLCSSFRKKYNQQEVNLFQTTNLKPSKVTSRRGKSNSPRRSQTKISENESLQLSPKRTNIFKKTFASAQHFNNNPSKTTREDSKSPSREEQIIPLIHPPPPNVTVRRKIVSNHSPTRPNVKQRSLSSDKEKNSPQKQCLYDPDLMKDYIKKQRHERFVKHKEEIAEKLKYEEEKKQKLKELQQKTNKIFMKNVKNAKRSKLKYPNSGGDGPEYSCISYRNDAQCDEINFRKKPVVVDGILAQSDEFFISSLRKPHISRSLQKDHVSRVDQVCSKNHIQRDRSKDKTAQSVYTSKSSIDLKMNITEKLTVPSATLLKNVNLIKRKVSEERQKAAIKIQAFYKGYRQRLVYQKVVEIKRRREEEAKQLLENSEMHFENRSSKCQNHGETPQNPSTISAPPQKPTPKWLQPAVSLPYPYNFITAVKRKLNLAVNINTTDSGTQYSPDTSLFEGKEMKVQNFDKEQNIQFQLQKPETMNAQENENIFKKTNKSDKIEVVEKATEKKQVDLKSFLSQKCLNLDLKAIEPLALTAINDVSCNKREKLPSDKAVTNPNKSLNGSYSESDTTKHVPDISDESIKVLCSLKEKIVENECDKPKKLPFDKIKSQSVQTVSTKFIDEAIQTTFSKSSLKDSINAKNSVENFVKQNLLIPPNESLLTGPPMKKCTEPPEIKDLNVSVADHLNERTAAPAESNVSILKNYWNTVSKNMPSTSTNQNTKASLMLSLSKSKVTSSSDSHRTDESFENIVLSSDKEEKSFKSLNTESDGSVRNKVSGNCSDGSSKSSGSQIRTNISQNDFITNLDTRKLSTGTIEENKYSSDFTNSSTKTTTPSTVPSLKRPSISLQSSHIITEEITAQSLKLTDSKMSVLHSNVQSECLSNQIHVKFEAELHLLDSVNNSLREVMAVEKSLMETQNRNSMLQNKDTQTLQTSKKPSESSSRLSVNTTAKNSSSVNFSRGSDVSDDLLMSLENASAFKELSCTDINLSQLNDTPTTINDTVDFFNVNKSFYLQPESLYTGISLGMFDQLIKEEDARIENLQQMCKIREQALNDRTRGQVYLLEIKRKALKDKGQTAEACLVKKRQRGLLVKLENEKHELHRIRQMNKAASRERKTILREQRNLIKAQLSATGNMIPKIRRSTGSMDRRNSGPIKVYKNRTDTVQSETSFSCRSSISEDVVSSVRSLSVRTSEERVTENAETTQKKSETEAGKAKSCIRTDTVKRSLLMREAALHKRRKAAEDLLQWHKRLTEEENKIAELESKANAIISKKPDVAELQNKLESPQETYYFNGAQLNLLWKNMTGREENKFDDVKTYTMSKIALESFCKDAREKALSQVKTDKKSTLDGTLLTSSSVKEDDASCVEEIVENNASNVTLVVEKESPSNNAPCTNVNSIKGNSVKDESKVEFSDVTEDDSIAEIRNSVLDSSKNDDASVESESNASSRSHFSANEKTSEVQSIVNSIISVAFHAEKTDSINNSKNESDSNSEISSIKLQNPPDSISNNVSVLQNNTETSIKIINDVANSMEELIESMKKSTEDSKISNIKETVNENTDYSTNFEDNEESVSTASVGVASPSSKCENVEDLISKIGKTLKDNEESVSTASVRVESPSSKCENVDLISQIGKTLKDNEESISTASIRVASPSSKCENVENLISQIREEVPKFNRKGPIGRETEHEVPSLTTSEGSKKSSTKDLIINIAAISSITEEIAEENTSPLPTPEKPQEAIVSELSESVAFEEDKQTPDSTIASENFNSSLEIVSEEANSNVSELKIDPFQDGISKTEENDKSAAVSEQINSNVSEPKMYPFQEEFSKTEENDKSAAVSEQINSNVTEPKIYPFQDEFSKTEESDKSAVDSEQMNSSVSEIKIDSFEDEVFKTEENEKSLIVNADAIAEDVIAEKKAGPLSEDSEEYITTQEDSSANSAEEEEKEDMVNNTEGITHVDIRKRVSEILADANNTPTRDNSPRLQDLYVTTYDIMSPTEEHSPELGSPNDSTVSTEKSGIQTEIFGEEAEELLRKQLAIEREIKELEKQQKEQLPYLFVREIPNKPPPPYTPPVLNVTPPVTSIIPNSDKQIDAIVAKATGHIFYSYSKDLLESCSLDAAKMCIENVSEDCCQFVFDLCKDIAIEHYKQFQKDSGPTWMRVDNKFSSISIQKPLDKAGLELYLKQKVKQLLGLENMSKIEKMTVKWCNKKRDHVDELLVLESQAEEAEWTNYDEDELIVKNEMANELFDMLLKETADVVNDILMRKSSLVCK